MTNKGMTRSIMTRFLTVLVVAVMATCMVPAAAFAETSAELQAQLDDANNHLNDLYDQAEQISEQLNDTQVQLDSTNQQIDQTQSDIDAKQSELDAAQDTLSKRVSSDYKSGGVSFLSIILDSSSFDELVSNIYYSDKVNEADADNIQKVKDIKEDLASQKSSLEDQKQQQQELLDQQQQQQDELTAQANEQQSYVDGLSQEVQQKMAEEKAAAEEAARKKAEEEAAAAAQAAAASSSSTSGPSADYSGNSPLSGDARSTIVSTAYSKVGCAYVWAAGGPSSFDCSGLVQYCYAAAGYSVPHSSSALSGYCTKPASQAVAGDIVWRSGHVGICIGNGATIEAMSPSQGVTFGSVSSFVSAGSPS
ncbi:MAG: NlpC/P60 family protein [Atopobiaceae bacterium]|jgi:peptidoglycan hydrolase CwlO-like protein|nr:NlpC/P60 family protein [Atopobiaceae bacterium]MCI2172953.1 NlpC/P60 family protein [Atopobiaceae bacterium]MCI2208358.1 NlpC/P60 family protein [Atopobiaceae bacterium]